MPLADDADDRLRELIDRAYDAAVDNRLWSGFAPEIARAFDSTSTVLKTHGAEGQVHLLETTDNLVIAPKDREWAEHWHRNDLWVERSVAFGLSRIVTNQDLMPDTEFERSGFYQDWNRHLGIYHVIGAAFPVDSGTIGVFGIHRDRRGDAYGEDDRRRVARFLPHLQRALQLRHRLAGALLEREVALDALDRMSTGMILVDSDCRVLKTNREAERILRRMEEVRVVSGRLTAADPSKAASLIRLVQQTLQSTSSMADGAFAIVRPGRLPMTVSVAPLRSAWRELGTPRPAVMVFIYDPESPTPASETLRHLFGLTRTEAAVASVLSKGKSIDETAGALGIGIGTVRSHLKKVLVKTGTSRQAQLVALILRSVAVLASPLPNE